ncbi:MULTISPECIES: FAD-dependent monooxygenase [Actinosynnema]|uniref:FAD-dependent monooxygenase n=1 Tax=Actinosynnema TaxID=40566 RepID=UPI0020A5680D|nr:FAD-dependent monooxygenase [Actinosynnema pretiosum]MCP2097265.1 2-polyprenyl-6-methoxyphenol hydroxylase [Actinosynnema pretiosum]
MTAPRAVISGASIAGLSAAHWLTRTGWHVTVLERAARFRDGGQNVDVRGVAHEVLDLMGLTEAVRALHTTETGTVFVDGRGQVIITLPTGRDGATAELEVLRGDLARAVLDRLPPGTDLRFGDRITEVDQSPDAVAVTTARGEVLTADLLVIAEGVGSTTRDLVFGPDVERRELGITMLFGTIPRTPADDDRWRWHNAVGGRQVHLRPDNRGTTRAMLAFTDDRPVRPTARQVRERYAGVGWEAPRVLDGFDATDDLYVDRLTQIRMPSWHRGRVCVTGDAAWCVTPMGGGGSSLALTGGYALAACLSTAEDLGAGLAAYEEWMRPLVDDVQKLPPGVRRIAYPNTRLGLALRNAVGRIATSAPLSRLFGKLTEVAATDRPLPRIAPA